MYKRVFAFLFLVAAFLIFVGLIFSFNFVYALEDQERMIVVADVYRFPEVVSIEVPGRVDIGNVTVGFSTKPTSEDKIYVRNTGTYNVSITPRLADPDDLIFSNLYFTERLSGERYNYQNIGYFDFDIPWSGSLTDYEEDYIYMKLDLTNFNGNINSDLIDHETDVIFYAVAN